MSRQQLSLAEQETSSSQAPYHSLRHKWQSSFTPLFLLSPQNLTILRGPLFWDNVLDTAEVYTHDQRLLNKLRELSRQFPESFVLKKSEPGRSEPTGSPSGAWASVPRTVSGAGNSSGRTHSSTACPL